MAVDPLHLRCRETPIAARIRHGRRRGVAVIGPEHPSVAAEDDVTVERPVQKPDMKIRAAIDERITKSNSVGEPQIESGIGAGGELGWERSAPADGEVSRTEPWPIIPE